MIEVLLTIDYNILKNRLGDKMYIDCKKEQFMNYYKESTKTAIGKISKIKLTNKKELQKAIKKHIKETALTKKDYNKIAKDIHKELLNNKYHIHINEAETIINILITKNKEINIDYEADDSDPAIYYHAQHKSYLINYDSIENRWYLSLIEEKTLRLIKEIYNDTYKNFIKYLKN